MTTLPRQPRKLRSNTQTMFKKAAMSIGKEPDKPTDIESFPLSSELTTDLFTPYTRTIYFNECDHRMKTHIKHLELDKYYYCDKCVLFRKISQITY